MRQNLGLILLRLLCVAKQSCLSRFRTWGASVNEPSVSLKPIKANLLCKRQIQNMSKANACVRKQGPTRTQATHHINQTLSQSGVGSSFLRKAPLCGSQTPTCVDGPPEYDRRLHRMISMRTIGALQAVTPIPRKIPSREMSIFKPKAPKDFY